MAMNKLWEEKHRPRTLSKIVFANDLQRETFERIVADGAPPSLLLTGHAGSGKTSIAGALINDLKVDRSDVMKINCSDEKIDAIRDKVKGFAYTMPMGEFKIVRLEEMDYLSQDAQALLRELMVEVSGSCRFIATANYLNKILPAMQSRFRCHVIAQPSMDQVLIAMADVLVAESVEFEIETLEKVVNAGYPDMRKIVQLLEDSSKDGTLNIKTSAAAAADWKLQLIPLLEAGDLKAARVLVCSSASREELVDVYPFLYRNLDKFTKQWDEAVIKIAQYEYQHQFVGDGEIQIAALFAELGAL